MRNFNSTFDAKGRDTKVSKRDSIDDFFKPQVRTNTYSYKMKVLNAEIKKQSYARKNPQFEKRKKQFFNTKQDKIEDRITRDLMRRIGFFQFQENNLDYIKAYKESQEKVVKRATKAVQEEIERRTRQLALPNYRMQDSVELFDK